MQIGIVGYGFVGQHVAEDVERAGHQVELFDPKLYQNFRIISGGMAEMLSTPREEIAAKINSCDTSFVCVPTPMAEDGSCDLSAINEVFGWLKTPIVIIRSTVPPGTTTLLQFNHIGQDIVFVPEFIGEGVNAPYLQMKQPPFLIIGGDPEARMKAGNVLSQIYNSECEFIYTDAVTAEMAKYAENYFLALKVSWANELYDICNKVGADFQQMMSAVAHDYRIGRSHTHVYPDNRGWDGRCLPKDLNALLSVAGDTAPLLASVIEINQKLRGKNESGG